MNQQSGCSSVGRAQASQAWGRGFEPRCPLQTEVGLVPMAAWIVRDWLPDSPVYVKVGSARFFYCLFPGIVGIGRENGEVFFSKYHLKR